MDRELGHWEYAWLIKQLQNKPIKCQKFNYTLES